MRKEKKAEEQQQQVARRNREGNNNADKASFALGVIFFEQADYHQSIFYPKEAFGRLKSAHGSESIEVSNVLFYLLVYSSKMTCSYLCRRYFTLILILFLSSLGVLQWLQDMITSQQKYA